MFLNKYFLSFFVLCVFVTGSAKADDEPITVVTSFSILENLVKELGGEHVNVVNLVGPNSDAHTYRPKPSDSVAVANAELVVLNGLAFEGWITRLLENSGLTKTQLVASKGIDPIMVGQEVDPHAWQSFGNIRVYISNITNALVAMRPQLSQEFKRRNTHYLQKLAQLERSLSQQFSSIQHSKRIAVTSHDAFAYLAREYDIQFFAPVGLNMEVEASAEDVASVIDQIRENKVNAPFVENITNPKLLKQIARETNATIGGRLYSDALSEQGGPADTYLNMMQYNIETLISAFSEQ